MLISIILAIFLGLIAGIIAGLIPGLHVNLISLIVFNIFASLSFADSFPVVIFLVSMATTSTFVDFIPSIFLGAPDEDTVLGVLPGHRFLLKGKGFAAIKLTVYGSLIALIIILILSPLFILFLPSTYELIKKYIPIILIAASLFLLMKEIKHKKFFWSLFLFLISGALGFLSLSFHFVKQPLLPLLGGLFGLGLLINSLFQNTRIPRQDFSEVKISKKEIFKASLASLIGSPLCSFLPGLGPSQAAVLGSSFFKKISHKGFLVLVGALNTIVMVLGFVALYAIQKPRHGVAVVIEKIIENFTLNKLILIILCVIFVGSLAAMITLVIARLIANKIYRVNYKLLSILVIIFIIILTLIFSGFTSILILIPATAIGLLANLKEVRKMHLMGCLILPVIGWFLI